MWLIFGAQMITTSGVDAIELDIIWYMVAILSAYTITSLLVNVFFFCVLAIKKPVMTFFKRICDETMKI